MQELFILLLLLLIGWLGATACRVVRCHRDLYDDFGARRCLVYEQWRRECIALLLKSLLLLLVSVGYVACSGVAL